MQRKQKIQTIAWFWDIYNRNSLNLDPPYQRRSVWNQAFKDYFIDTILLQYPSPAIFLHEKIKPSGVTTYNVVDGKQRLTTIFAFINNEFPIYAKAKKNNLVGKYFNDLDNKTKTEFWSYQFYIESLPNVQESIIEDIFDRINRNTARLTAQELRHAKYCGKFITVAEDMTELLQEELPINFPYIASQSRKQMKDVELVAQLLLLLEDGPRNYTSLQLDQAFSDRDDEWERSTEIKSRFIHIIQIIRNLLNTSYKQDLLNSRLRNQTDFYSLFGAIDDVIQEEYPINSEAWATRLLNFIYVVDDEKSRYDDKKAFDYYEASRLSSTKTTQRKTRARIIKEILCETVNEPVKV